MHSALSEHHDLPLISTIAFSTGFSNRTTSSIGLREIKLGNFTAAVALGVGR